jgi:DNA polymerase elongation subunit (family B)
MIKKEELADVQKFLEGSSDKKHIVAIEGYSYHNYVECIIHDPLKGKMIEKMEYKPFIWLKDLPSNGVNIYKDVEKRKEALDNYGLTIKKLKTGSKRRLEQGYKFIIHSTKSFNAIVSFFKDENIDIYDEKYRNLFFAVKPEEQFMIQKGIRLFKGYEKYNEVHKLTYDIETTGLLPENSRIFMIGIKDNRGFEHVCKIKKTNDDDEERKIIKQFFYVVNKLKPSIITTYNGENFDYDFIFKRCELLGIDIQTDVRSTLNPDKHIRRKENATVKYGNETGHYTQTIAWGYNIIDTIHAAKKTAAINKEIKNVKLKYLCQFEKIAKPNRMYINNGGHIYKYWQENKYFFVNSSNNNYIQAPNELQDLIKQLHESNQIIFDNEIIKNSLGENIEQYDKVITGSAIVDRYLLDDLWETEMLDNRYNESSFLLAKLIPTTFSRVCTMGTAAVWNLIMSEWSYINDLAIPIPDVGGKNNNNKIVAVSEENDEEEDELEQAAHVEESDSFDKISGGLARAYRIGYAEDILKLDFASLYPSIQLTHGVFPNIDITNQLKKILLYLKITRDEYKYLSNDKSLDEELQQFYKTKQLPIKILNNSLFGALGSGVAFRWSDNDVAYRITTTGRVYLRQLIDWFYKRQFLPLLAVTDGVNFSIPEYVDIDINLNKLPQRVPIDSITYVDKDGIEYKGTNAYVEKYNNEVLINNEESVTFDTPVYIMDIDQNIDIVPISELFNENSECIDETGDRDFSNKNFKILTKSGWSNIKYVYRHKTNKKIHRIQTKDRLIKLTEDHSLFKNDVEVKPSNLKRGDKIDTIDIPTNINNLNNLNEDTAWLMGFFMGDGSSVYNQRYGKNKNGIKIKLGMRAGWKISNTNLSYLKRLKDILLNEYNIVGKIIDRTISQRKSGNIKTLYELVTFDKKISIFYSENFYTSFREKKVAKIILNSNNNIKTSFLDGLMASDGYGIDLYSSTAIGQKTHVGISGISYLLKCVGVDYNISSRKDKVNYITLLLIGKNKDNHKKRNKIALSRKTDLVWKNEIIDYDGYVYDVSTDDETFVAGCGGILCHNTSGKKSYLKIDNDGKWKSTLILSRINYANLTYETIDKKSGKVIPPKIKLTGNTIKSNTMPEYIEDFINVGMKYILENKPDLFIEYYYEYLAKIFYKQIPLKKIATKGKVKMTIKSYKTRGLNKNGKEKGKQAHMELLAQSGIPYEVGDLIYYVNTGTAKSHGDTKLIKDKITKEIRMASHMIDAKQLEQNPNLLGDYNLAKYIDNFNKRVEKILIGFSENVRNSLLKDDPTKREYFTDLDLKLYCHEKDNIEESMYLEQKEIEFWQKTGFNPYLITDVFKLPDGVDLKYNEYRKVVDYINNKLKPMNKVAVDVNEEPIEDNFVIVKKINTYEIHLYKDGFMRKVKEIDTKPIFEQ